MKVYLHDCLKMICSISKNENSNILYDCNKIKVYSYSKNKCEYIHNNMTKIFENCQASKNIRYFTTINKAYRNSSSSYEFSVVWILVGKKGNYEEIIQVGRNKSINHMLNNDINIDARYILEGGDKKYSSQKYDVLTFYQVDIDKFLNKNDDEIIYSILNENPPLDKNLKAAYYNFKAAYVEGKLASLENAKLWKSSGEIDGDIYNYFQMQKR